MTIINLCEKADEFELDLTGDRQLGPDGLVQHH